MLHPQGVNSTGPQWESIFASNQPTYYFLTSKLTDIGCMIVLMQSGTGYQARGSTHVHGSSILQEGESKAAVLQYIDWLVTIPATM